MALTPKTFLIVCPLLFLAGFVDSIGGGGGLISLPAYLLAGVPIHSAIGTNKLSSAFGTTVTTVRFARQGLIHAKLSIPSVIFAVLGSAIGARISLWMDERIMKYLLIVVLPLAAALVLNKHLFRDQEDTEIRLDRRTLLTASISALVIGMYDGLYGPGTGTFLIIAFTVFARLGIGHANAQSKVINLTTNITSLTVFLLNGQVIVPLGLVAAVCNMAGNFLGSGLAVQNGTKIVRPIILIVLALLLIKILT